MSNVILTKTEALAAAQKAVGSIIPRGFDAYSMIGPYRVNDIDGPETERYARTYPEAQAVRAAWVAEIALALMGHRLDMSGTTGEAKERIDQALAFQGRCNTRRDLLDAPSYDISAQAEFND